MYVFVSHYSLDKYVDLFGIDRRRRVSLTTRPRHRYHTYTFISNYVQCVTYRLYNVGTWYIPISEGKCSDIIPSDTCLSTVPTWSDLVAREFIWWRRVASSVFGCDYIVYDLICFDLILWARIFIQMYSDLVISKIWLNQILYFAFGPSLLR